MAQNEIARQAASDIATALTTYLEGIADSSLNVQRPAQNYTILCLQPADGSDWEEIIVDTRGEEPRVIRRTIARD